MGEPAVRNRAGSLLQMLAAARSTQRCPACLQCHHTLQEGSLEECFDEGNSDHSHEEKTEEESKGNFHSALSNTSQQITETVSQHAYLELKSKF